MKSPKTHFIVLYVLLFTALGWLVISTAIQPPQPESIFRRHLNTVVEVRAFNNDAETDRDKAFGSAVAIKREGVFVTNAHVVTFRSNETFENVQVRFATSEDYIQAEVYRIDRETDLALLKIDTGEARIRPARIRTSDLRDGETVFAIGNAQNYGISIKQGLIAQRELTIVADGRTITAIQCALHIVAGSSGGALVDSRGRLIGITTFRLRDFAAQPIYGISFAIPMSIVQEFIS